MVAQSSPLQVLVRFVFKFVNIREKVEGFTLIEILIVIAIMAVLAALTIPVGVNFFVSQQLDTVVDEVMQVLRRAQLKGMTQERDSDWGIRFNSDTYVLFKGSSFASRDPVFDEDFDLAGGITTSGISEVVFAKFSGVPNVIGTITISQGSKSKAIDVNAVGKIDRE